MDGQWEIINNTLARIHSIREREETIATNHSVFPERALKARFRSMLVQKKLATWPVALEEKKNSKKKKKRIIFSKRNS